MDKLTKVHLISFCNIFDDSSPKLSSELMESKNKFLEIGSALFNSVRIWSAADFKMEFPESANTVENYYEKYAKDCEKISLNINKDWLRAGCFMWKPQLVKFSLETICEEGDILIYQDINLKRYPKYKHNLLLGRSFYSNNLRKHSILLFKDNLKPLSFDCKKWLLNRYLANFFDYGLYLQGLWAGLICIRNDVIGREFISGWAKLSTLENCGPLPDVLINERHPNFVWHSQEQSTLAVYLYKNLNIFNNAIKILPAPGRKAFTFKRATLKDVVSYLGLVSRLRAQSIYRKLILYPQAKLKCLLS